MRVRSVLKKCYVSAGNTMRHTIVGVAHCVVLAHCNL